MPFAPRPKALVAMIHVGALPGTPSQTDLLPTVIGRAAEEARLLAQAGVDAIMIENMHDRPYLLRQVGAEITAAMTAIGRAVRQAVDLPLGVQILAGANREALAVAQACEASFIRAEGFVFGHLADEGFMDRADAAPLLRYRRQIGADNIAVWADVKKKHASHALTADVDLPSTARAAEFFGANGIVITGTETGRAAQPADVRDAANAVGIPTVIGSGITPDNLADYWDLADAFIVGSCYKQDGHWANPPDPDRLSRLVGAFQASRQ